MIDRSNEFRDNEPQNGDDFFFLVNLVVLDSSIDLKNDSVHVHRTRSISFLLRVTRMDEWNRGLFLSFSSMKRACEYFSLTRNKEDY